MFVMYKTGHFEIFLGLNRKLSYINTKYYPYFLKTYYTSLILAPYSIDNVDIFDIKFTYIYT